MTTTTHTANPLAEALRIAAELAASNLNPAYAQPLAQQLAEAALTGCTRESLHNVAGQLDVLADAVGLHGIGDDPDLTTALARWTVQLRSSAGHAPLAGIMLHGPSRRERDAFAVYEMATLPFADTLDLPVLDAQRYRAHAAEEGSAATRVAILADLALIAEWREHLARLHEALTGCADCSEPATPHGRPATPAAARHYADELERAALADTAIRRAALAYFLDPCGTEQASR